MAILKNDDQIPEAAIPVLVGHATILLAVLFEKLVGIYLHGSAAMGGFSWEQSDIDYVAVISVPLAATERTKLVSSFLEIFDQNVPRKGVEMSIVLDRFAGDGFRYPTPYEFHFGTQDQIRLHGVPHATEMVDPDMAAHFTIIKRRGICIYGKPIDEVFGEVPREHYLSSIIADAEDSFRNIQSRMGDGSSLVPTYAVLNACRVLAYVQEELILSKVEGAEWGLSNLPSKFQSIILAARGQYISGAGPHIVSGILLKEFATYAQKACLTS